MTNEVSDLLTIPTAPNESAGPFLRNRPGIERELAGNLAQSIPVLVMGDDGFYPNL